VLVLEKEAADPCGGVGTGKVHLQGRSEHRSRRLRALPPGRAGRGIPTPSWLGGCKAGTFRGPTDHGIWHGPWEKPMFLGTLTLSLGSKHPLPHLRHDPVRITGAQM